MTDDGLYLDANDTVDSIRLLLLRAAASDGTALDIDPALALWLCRMAIGERACEGLRALR